MKPIAYVSDENYVAPADVKADLEALEGDARFLLTSSARGALYGEIPAGPYRVTLAQEEGA